MSDNWCPTCTEFMFTHHRCPPKWLVWSIEREDAKTVYAIDAESAAEEWAERYDRDCCDYPLAGGSEAVVHVESCESDEVSVFTVYGEAVASYSATPRRG